MVWTNISYLLKMPKFCPVLIIHRQNKRTKALKGHENVFTFSNLLVHSSKLNSTGIVLVLAHLFGIRSMPNLAGRHATCQKSQFTHCIFFGVNVFPERTTVCSIESAAASAGAASDSVT